MIQYESLQTLLHFLDVVPHYAQGRVFGVENLMPVPRSLES